MLLPSAPLVEILKTSYQQKAQKFLKTTGTPPGLAVVLVGDDPPSQIYTRKKQLMAKYCGFKTETFYYPSTLSWQSFYAKIQKLNADPHYHGILIQRPLPAAWDPYALARCIDPAKDVDGFHPEQIGNMHLKLPQCLVPCTPLGILELLKFYAIPLVSKIAVVVGRSHLVGRPVAELLLQQNASVIQCHSETLDLKNMTRMGDIVIVAIGKQGFLDRSYFKDHAVVVDVGIHKQGLQILGDVAFHSETFSSLKVTPVPGGVGPMTIMMLLHNTLIAACAQSGLNL